MYINEKNSWIKHFDFILLNLLALVIAFACAYIYKFGNYGFLTDDSWRTVLFFMCLINLIVTFIANPYSGIFRRAPHEDVIKLLALTVYSFIVVSVMFYLLKIGYLYSRVTIVLTYSLYFVLSVLFLYIRKSLIMSGRLKGFANIRRKMFVVTDHDRVVETVENIKASDVEEYDIVGFCFPEDDVPMQSYDSVPVVALEMVAGHIITEHIDDVFVNVDPCVLSPTDYRKMVDNEVTVHLSLESMIGIETDDQFISNIGVYKSASVGPYTVDGKRVIYMMLKRLLDIVFGIIGCIILIPLTGGIKIASLMSGDTAPIFYTQTRVGYHGNTFEMMKYRSMVPTADKMLEELLKEENYRKEWEANQKFTNDPRITKVGRFLRRTSLDEFPQFINVFKGEMSLIGPRPLVVGELEEHNGLTLYNKVKPGIAGWWGCNGRSNISYRERLDLEYYYVKNCSLYLDVLCIVRTMLAVLKRDGAQ